MGNLELESAQDNQLINDIDKCLATDKIDRKLVLFLHICVQTGEDTKKGIEIGIEDDKKEKKFFNMSAYEEFCERLLTDIEFVNWCDLHYEMISNQEESRIYLDRQKNDTPEYQLNEKMYMRIKRLDYQIAKFLGLLKTRIKVTSSSIPTDFHK